MMAIADLATPQHGAVSRSQLLEAGWSSSGIARRVAAGGLRAVDDGVYVVKGARSSWLQNVMTACLATRGLASHFTAGRLWKLELPAATNEKIDVVVNAARRPRSTRAINVHRTRGALDGVILQGVPTCELGPTLIQLGEGLKPAALERAVDSASLLRPGILFWLADTLVASRRGHASSLEFRDLLGDLLSDGTLDADVEALIAQARLAPPLRRYRGLEFAWPQHRLALQTFNHQDHGQGQPLDQLTREGWRVLVTHEREVKSRPKALISRLRAVLLAPR